MSEKLLSKYEVLAALLNVSKLPRPRKGLRHRTIYEYGEGSQLRPSGCFGIDYASFPGGVTGDVPLAVIEELLRENLIKPAYPQSPDVKAWILA